MMTEFRISIRPRLGQDLGIGLDQLTPLLAAGIVRRAHGASAVASNRPGTPGGARIPQAGTDGKRESGLMSGEQTALRAPRQQMADSDGPPAQAQDQRGMPAPYLRLVETPARPARSESVSEHARQGAGARTDPDARAGQDMRARPDPSTSRRPDPSAAAQADPRDNTPNSPDATDRATPLSSPLAAMIHAAVKRREVPRSPVRAAPRVGQIAPAEAPSGREGRVSPGLASGRAAHSALRLGRDAPPAPAQPGAAKGFARSQALSALDRAFARHADSATLPRLQDPAPDQIARADLREAIEELLEEDLLRHGLSPLGKD